MTSELISPAALLPGRDLHRDANTGRWWYRDGGGAWLPADAQSREQNILNNSGFWFAQRQTPGTLTTYSDTTGRTLGADRWAVTNETASVQYARVDTAGAPETGCLARFYGKYKKITVDGKLCISQTISCGNMTPYRGRTMRLQLKAKAEVGTHTLRLGLLQLTAAGTANTVPGISSTFISAFGAVSTDPTFGTNLAAIVPLVSNGNGTVSGNFISCSLTSAWTLYGGLFTVPSDAKNLVVVAFTDAQMAANDIFDIGEAGLYAGEIERVFTPEHTSIEYIPCAHHCWKTFGMDVGPVQNAGALTGEHRFLASIAANTNERSAQIYFPTPMFAAPTVTFYNPAVANAQARDFSANADCSSTATLNLTERGLVITCVGPVTAALADLIGVHMLCEAPL